MDSFIIFTPTSVGTFGSTITRTFLDSLLFLQLINKIIKGCTKEYDCGWLRFQTTKARIKEQVFAKIDQSNITFMEGKPFVFGIEIEDGGTISRLVDSVKGRIGEEIDKL